MDTSLAERVAAYATGLRFERLSAAAVHEVKRRVLDSIGCAFGAFNAEPCVVARKVASQLSAGPGAGATLWGTAHRAPLDWAAFANGALVRYLDYNDTYLSKEPAHPSDNIPAAFAAAEAAGKSGRDVIAAIVAAYEVQCRFCDAASLRSIGFDHVTYGCFSSATAAGMLMGLGASELRHALGIAGVASAALRQTRVGELSHWKGCAFANAARHGVFAATLAKSGMTGPHPIFEGEKGFEKLVSQRPIVVEGPFARAVPADRETAESQREMILGTSIKCWPVEYHAQSAVEASLAIRGEILSHDAGGSVAERIRSVLVESHDAAVDIIGSEPEKWRPTSRETADHSLPYIVGAALADGRMTPASFDEARFTNADLLELVGRVGIRRHAELSAMYPQAVGNIVTVTLADGRTVSRRVDYPVGHAKNPMSDAAVEQKFHAMANAVIGVERARELAKVVWRLEELADVREFIEAMRVPV
ncbi:MAG: MmgE/PrpD family protein [Phycisphaerae bacterium]